MKFMSSIAWVVALMVSSSAFAVSPLLREIEDTFITLSETVGPSVVEISVEQEVTQLDDEALKKEFFDFFENRDQEAPEMPQRPNRRPPVSKGSGFFIDRQGHIITNNHVVENGAKITVTLADGSEHAASVIGTDKGTDVAVIKIDSTNANVLPVPTGDSDTLRVGQFAVALGSPRGLTGSVSFGHISGLGRERLDLPDQNLRFQHFIQTDAAINLGNSGGPLCNIDGQVIGVNIAIVSGANSIGFAIPINRVKQILPQLIDSGRVIRGWLGVSIQDVEVVADREGLEVSEFIDAFGLEDEKGAYVAKVTWRGPSERGGLRKEDIVWKIDDKDVVDTLDLINQISLVPPGSDVVLKVWRESKLIDVNVQVDEFPGIDGATYGADVLGMHVLNPSEVNPVAAQQLGFTDDTPGAFIPRIVPKSAAAKADINPFLLIVKVAFEDVKDKDHLIELVNENAKPGKKLLLHVKDKTDGEPIQKFLTVPEGFVQQ